MSNSRHAAHGTTTCMCMCMLHVTPCLHKQPRVYDPQGAESLPLWLFGQGGGRSRRPCRGVSPRPRSAPPRRPPSSSTGPRRTCAKPLCAQGEGAWGRARGRRAPSRRRASTGSRTTSAHKSTRFARPQLLSRGRQAPRSRRASRRAELLRLRRHQPRHSSPPARSDAGEPWLLAAAGAAAPQALAQRGAAIWAIRGARARLGGRGRFPRARSIPSSQRGPRRHEGPMC